VLFQILPISPGSLVRGFYVLYLVIKERNFKDYNIAVFLGFFKYIGYLAFPIQMTYHYPVLARFMAAHWATEFVHIVPVFGEHGALLEHKVFYVFYNWPLTIRRRMKKIAEVRAKLKPRYWHIPLCIIAAIVILEFVDSVYISNVRNLPKLSEIWWLVVIISLFCGAVMTLNAAGAKLWKRFAASAIAGASVGIIATSVSLVLSYKMGFKADEVVIDCLWKTFLFVLLSTLGAILAELRLPEPDLK
jgi:hypothetical protein